MYVTSTIEVNLDCMVTKTKLSISYTVKNFFLNSAADCLIQRWLEKYSAIKHITASTFWQLGLSTQKKRWKTFVS